MCQKDCDENPFIAYNAALSAGLSDVLRKHTYVGMADETLALLQHGTRLYLLDIANLSKDMFYQQVQTCSCCSTQNITLLDKASKCSPVLLCWSAKA